VLCSCTKWVWSWWVSIGLTFQGRPCILPLSWSKLMRTLVTTQAISMKSRFLCIAISMKQIKRKAQATLSLFALTKSMKKSIRLISFLFYLLIIFLFYIMQGSFTSRVIFMKINLNVDFRMLFVRSYQMTQFRYFFYFCWWIYQNTRFLMVQTLFCGFHKLLTCLKPSEEPQWDETMMETNQLIAWAPQWLFQSRCGVSHVISLHSWAIVKECRHQWKVDT